MFSWIFLLQGAIFSCAWGCGLKDVCGAGGFISRTVDSSSDIQVSARCSGSDASSSSWYIRRYRNGNDSLDDLGAPLTLNDSFRQSGNELTIREVNGFAEGTYHCGVDNTTIQPASLCLFVRGEPIFTSCPGINGTCPSIMRINATENSNVSIDTRINFVNGGFCNMTKKIRILTVRNGQGEQLYLCSNLTTFSNQLCDDTEKFKVDQQQPCTGPDITLCKYDMKLILLNFGPSDEGLYNVEVEFENDGRGRGMLMLQFNITLSNEDTPTEMPNTGPFSLPTTSSTTSTTSNALSGGIIAGIVVAAVIGVVIFITPIILLILIIIYLKGGNKAGGNQSARQSSGQQKPDEYDQAVVLPNMVVVIGDKIVTVGDSAEHVNIYSRKLKKIRSFKIERGEKNPCPRGVSTDGKYLFISDKANESIMKYTIKGRFIVESGNTFGGRCGIAINKKMERVYVAHESDNKIEVLDLNLDPILNGLEFGKEGDKKKEFKQPRDVAVARDDKVYVSDTNNNRIQVFSADGDYITEFGNTGTRKDKLSAPAGLCVDRDNHILVADHGNNRVCIFDSNGKLLKPNEKIEANFKDLIGIAVDRNGKIYTADYGGNSLQVFEPQK